MSENSKTVRSLTWAINHVNSFIEDFQNDVDKLIHDMEEVIEDADEYTDEVMETLITYRRVLGHMMQIETDVEYVSVSRDLLDDMSEEERGITISLRSLKAGGTD